MYSKEKALTHCLKKCLPALIITMALTGCSAKTPMEMTDSELCEASGAASAYGNQARFNAIVLEGKSRVARHTMSLDEDTCASFGQSGYIQAKGNIEASRAQAIAQSQKTGPSAFEKIVQSQNQEIEKRDAWAQQVQDDQYRQEQRQQQKQLNSELHQLNQNLQSY